MWDLFFKVSNFNIILQSISPHKPQLLSLKFPYFRVSKNWCFRTEDVQNHHLCLSHCVSHALVGKELSPPWMAVSQGMAQAKAWEDLQTVGTCPDRATGVASSKLAVPCFGERLEFQIPQESGGTPSPWNTVCSFQWSRNHGHTMSCLWSSAFKGDWMPLLWVLPWELLWNVSWTIY